MLIATLSLTFTACSSDDDEPNNSGEAIDLADTRLDISSWTGEATNVFNETVPFDVLEFHSNGTVTESNFKADTYVTGTYTQSGNIVTFSGLSRWSTIWGSTFTIFSHESWDGKEMITFRPTANANTSLGVGFDCYVYRSSNGNNGGSGSSGGNGGNGGNEGGGNNGGSGSNYHHECSACDGTGDCWNCYGTGTDPITRRKCNTCHGSGKCQICHGKGYIIV